MEIKYIGQNALLYFYNKLKNIFAPISHTHDYAGSSSAGGSADSAVKLNTKRYIDGVGFDGSANINHYGTCSTAAATVAKTVSITGFSLVTGAKVTVTFTNGNTAASPTLNVTSTGAKPIYYQGAAVPTDYIQKGAVLSLVYSGAYWRVIGDLTQYQVDTLKTQLDNLPSASFTVKTLWSGALYTDTIINFYVPQEYWHDGNLTLMIDCVRTGATSAYPHAKTVMLCLPRYHTLYSYAISANMECNVYSAHYTGDGTIAYGNVYEKFTDKTGGCNDIIDIEAWVNPLTTTNYAAVYIQKKDSSVYVITNAYAVVPEEG